MVKGNSQIQQNIGSRIKELREKRSHTQESLAFKSGLDRTYINSADKGRKEKIKCEIKKAMDHVI